MPYKNKEQEKQHNKEYYLKNKDKIIANNKKNRENDIERIRKRDREYYHRNKSLKKRIKLTTLEQKERDNARKRLYYKKNRKKILLYKLKYKGKRKEYYKKRYQEKKEEINKKVIDRRKNNPEVRLRHNFSALVREKLKRRIANKAGKGIFKLLPYTIDDLIKHLESKFKNGMDWNNYGRWHIDHVIADCKFNYISTLDDEFQKSWSLNNLQPLWAIDNFIKNKF